jgi:multiple sugar transport system substrate-binding protein
MGDNAVLRIVGCLALGLTLVLSAGCGGGESRVTLRVANWGGAGDDSDLSKEMKLIYQEFEQKNPGIKVQIEGIPGSQEYVNKMLLSFVSKTEPDVMQLDASSAAVFIENDLLEDVTSLAAADPNFSWDDYWPELITTTSRGPARYSVPLDFTPMAIYCNAKLFREAGVSLPRNGWTFNEFREASRRLTKKDQYGFAFSNWMPGWILFLWNSGGDVLSEEAKRASGTLDSDSNAEMISDLRDMIEVDKSAPSLSAAAALGVDLFANGQAAMMLSGHWSLVGLKASDKVKFEDLHVAAPPLAYSGRLRGSISPRTVLYQSSLAISKGSKKKEEAWKFLTYMTSAAVQRRIHKTGLAVCGRKDVAAELAKSPQTKAFLELIPLGKSPWGSKVVGYDYVETEGTKMMDGVLQAGIGPKEALTQAAKRIDRYFDEAR